MKNSTNHSNKFRNPKIQGFENETRLLPKFYFFKILLSIFLVLNFSVVFSSCQKTDKAVFEAYELRIQGNVDEAKELLQTIIKEDSTNAMAHFELARILNYVNLRGSKKADTHLNKALKYDSDNVTYAYYNAKNCFLKAYIAAQQGGDNIKGLVNNACDEFLRVLELKADYPEVLMYLVEIYGMLPEDMGGDKIKAEEYTLKLEAFDKFYGAKARLVLMPEGTDMVEYWNNFIEKNGESCHALKALGNVHIFRDDINSAKKAFTKAIALDNSQNIRLLDLARFHMMKVMQKRDLADKELQKAKVYTDQYLSSTPEPIVPLKAYALGMKVKTEMFNGNKEAGEKLMAEAKAIDPYFSRAFGIPSLSIFEAPTQIDHHFKSYFTPF